MGFRTFASMVLLGVILTGCGSGGGGDDNNNSSNTADTTDTTEPAAPVSTAACTTELTSILEGLLAETNLVRSNHDAPPLRLSLKLGEAAQDHAEDMVARDYFAHTSPDGASTISSRIDEVNYDFSAAGENLAAGFNSPQEVVTAWLNSPSHRENLLDPDFVDVGFGLFLDPVSDTEFDSYWVQNLGRPTDSNTDSADVFITDNCPVEVAEEVTIIADNTRVLSGQITADGSNATAAEPALVVISQTHSSQSTPEPAMALGLLPMVWLLLRSQQKRNFSD